jgi:hypothetical protein
LKKMATAAVAMFGVGAVATYVTYKYYASNKKYKGILIIIDIEAWIDIILFKSRFCAWRTRKWERNELCKNC